MWCKSFAPHFIQITTMPAPHHSVSTGRMPFLLPNQQCQSTEGMCYFMLVCCVFQYDDFKMFSVSEMTFIGCVRVYLSTAADTVDTVVSSERERSSTHRQRYNDNTADAGQSVHHTADPESRRLDG